MRPNLQHAIERVERPGGSHEGVGRKKRGCGLRQNFFLMAISSKGETATFKPPSNIEDGARGFKHTSNPHLGFATASLESGSANIDDSPLQECRCRDSPQEL